jgi:hypothetical protein
VEETKRLESSAKIRAQIQQALDERKVALDEQLRIEKQLSDALEQARAMKAATAWIEDVGKAVAVGELYVEVNKILGPKADKDLLDAAAKAKTAQEFKAVIGNADAAQMQTIKVLEGSRAVLYQKLEIYKKTIIDNGRTHGAPEGALKF